MVNLPIIALNADFFFVPKRRNDFRSTSESTNGESSSAKLFAVDCEMVRTTKGQQCARMSLLDAQERVVADMLVKPKWKILDYNTRYSGLKREDFLNVTATLEDAQNVILSNVTSEDILVGHDIQNDLSVLRLFHGKCVDTSKIFPHMKSIRNAPSLKYLASKYLNRQIQHNPNGHCSVEDARTCLQLLKWREKFEEKVGNGWYGNKEEAKEAIVLKHRIQPDLDLDDEDVFHNLLLELRIKLSWENALFIWYSERGQSGDLGDGRAGSPIWHVGPVPEAARQRKTARFGSLEEAQCAIRAYKGGKPKLKHKFENWCKSSLSIDASLVDDLWIWYSEARDPEVSQPSQGIPNQFANLDEAKLAIIAKAHSGIPTTKAKFSQYLSHSLHKKVPKVMHHELWYWAKKRYS